MRFQQQSSILKNALELLVFDVISVNTTLGSRVRIKNVRSFTSALKLLDDLKYLNPELDEVKDIGFFDNVSSNAITVSSEEFNIIQQKVNRLKSKIQQNIAILKNTIIKTDENTLCIKVVEHDSLKDLGTELELLDKIIMQVISHKKINGTYKFSSFDIGSSWIYIAVGSALVLKLLAALVWSACVIRKKFLEGNLLEEKLKSLEIKNDSLKDIREANKKQLELLLKTEAQNIMHDFDLENTDNEYENRLIYSIRELSKLINEGAQVQPSLLVPEEAKNLFPDYKNLDLIESKTKLLETKN